MARTKLSDLDKLINYIKKTINAKDLEVPNETISKLQNSLSFEIAIADIEDNVEEQIITYTNTVVDFVFLHKYIQKRRNIVLKSLERFSTSFKTDLDKFQFVYTMTIQMIREEYCEETFSNPLMKEYQTQKTKILWDSLARYVKYNILNYKPEQALHKNIYLKLQELVYGRVYGNKKQRATCEYSLENILYTFKYSYFDIQKALAYKSFDNDVQKISYVCAIVKNNINDVMRKIENSERAKRKMEEADLSHLTNIDKPRNYIRRTEECLPELEDLW